MLDNFKGFEKKAARVYVVIMIARGGLVWMNNPPSVSWSSSQNGLIEIQNGGYSLVILL